MSSICFISKWTWPLLYSVFAWSVLFAAGTDAPGVQTQPTPPTIASTQPTAQVGVLVGGSCRYDTHNAQSNCVPHAECTSNSVCMCAPGFHMNETSKECKMLVGETCSDNNNCTTGAKCKMDDPNLHTTGVCTCEDTHYKSNEHLCEPRIRLNTSCTPLESGHSPCVNPEYTMCHNTTCVCNAYYYDTGNNMCSPRVLAGNRCQASTTACVSNAQCNSTTNTCVCDPGFFRNNSGHCQYRLSPGAPCSLASAGEDPCTEGGTCHDGVCTCNPYLYKPSASRCIPVVFIGDACTSTANCSENAHCDNHPNVCKCDDNYFHDTIKRVCQERKSAGSRCVSSEECVANGGCVHGVCVCNLHYYSDNHRCNVRVQLHHPCDALIPDQCLLNGECVHGQCQCNNRSYVNERTNCPLTLPFGESCNWENHDSRQCESNTSCIFRPTDSLPVCGCDINHFFNGKVCVKRALAGDSCPYDSAHSFGLNITLEEFNKQCVENAECTTTANLCECRTNHYDKDGRCPQRIQGYHPCDPWTDYPNQCVDGYVCLYGQCVLNDDPNAG